MHVASFSIHKPTWYTKAELHLFLTKSSKYNVSQSIDAKMLSPNMPPSPATYTNEKALRTSQSASACCCRRLLTSASCHNIKDITRKNVCECPWRMPMEDISISLLVWLAAGIGTVHLQLTFIQPPDNTNPWILSASRCVWYRGKDVISVLYC